MSRDFILPVAGVCLALYCLVAYGKHCRRAAQRSAAALPRPLQTWEGEGGAVPVAAADEAPRPPRPAR